MGPNLITHVNNMSVKCIELAENGHVSKDDSGGKPQNPFVNVNKSKDR